jgi:glycosyltransferase involved in cell wall biosynthesis
LLIQYLRTQAHRGAETERNATMSTSGEPTLDGARIILVVSSLELGGAERQALLLAEYLTREENARVEFWGLGDLEGVVARACEELGIPWRLFPVNWFTRKSEKARDLTKLTLALRRARPDAILSYLIVPNVACGLIWRWTGARVCIWNQRCAGIDRVGVRAERLAVRRVPWFTANSRIGAEFLTGTLGAPPDRVRVIHNGIQLASPQLDRAAWRSSLGLRDDAFTVCMVANLTKFKDHTTLLRAWRLVVDELENQGRSGVLLLAGRFDQTHDHLKALAFDLNLGKSVRFLGSVKDVSGLLAAVDLAVLSSLSESSPNGILEAMAVGLAVVGTDNPGMREVVGPDGCQFLAPPGDAEAFANRILRLATDPSLRAEVGSANALRIEREFNPRRTGQKMVSLIIEGMQDKKADIGNPVPIPSRKSLPTDTADNKHSKLCSGAGDKVAQTSAE